MSQTHRRWLVPSGRVDPATIPDEELLRFRGSIWTARAPIAFGPRPFAADNILAMDYFESFTATDQARMLDEYVVKRKYRHAPSGPWVDPGYHDEYPSQDFRVDGGVAQAEALQQMWDGGAYPVCFLTPDLSPTTGGPWTLEEVEQLTPIFQRPEWQRVVRLAVPFGWEPGGYNISNAEWCARFAWARRCFPNALLGLHMIADFDAPIGGDDGPAGMTKEQAWLNVYDAGCRFFLDQVGGYINGPEVPTPTFLADYAQRVAYYVAKFASLGIDLRYVAGEYAAYADYWYNYGEQYSVQLGDVAMANGARGFFDGGTAT